MTESITPSQMTFRDAWQKTVEFLPAEKALSINFDTMEAQIVGPGLTPDCDPVDPGEDDAAAIMALWDAANDLDTVRPSMALIDERAVVESTYTDDFSGSKDVTIHLDSDPEDYDAGLPVINIKTFRDSIPDNVNFSSGPMNVVLHDSEGYVTPLSTQSVHEISRETLPEVFLVADQDVISIESDPDFDGYEAAIHGDDNDMRIATVSLMYKPDAGNDRARTLLHAFRIGQPEA